jgi:23S rRNA pseudouridine1911/1915/1917 synthase
METLTVGADSAGQRLDHFLSRALPERSRAHIQEWIEAGRVRAGGSVRKASYKLRAGEVVEYEPAPRRELRAVAEEIPLDILYEDAAVVAVNKPAGMVVHAGAGRDSGTLVNALLHRYGALSSEGGPLRPGIVHRLDKGTSGVVLVAKTDPAHRALAAQFAGRTVEKIYLAIVEGSVKPERGKIERTIARDPVRRTRMTARLETGRSAYTEFHVLRRYQRFTKLEVKIGTGRTHQIRVHMASLKHPIVCDTLYGAAAHPAGAEALGRPWLHAWRITFTSPEDGRRVSVEAPVAAELVSWESALLE